jgi:hypothetical protein
MHKPQPLHFSELILIVGITIPFYVFLRDKVKFLFVLLSDKIKVPKIFATELHSLQTAKIR